MLTEPTKIKVFWLIEEYSKDRKVIDYHGRFMKLKELGVEVISLIPSYSSHMELGQLPPRWKFKS